MASKKTSKSRQPIKDLSPRERQAKGVKGGRDIAATRAPIETTLPALARPALREPGTREPVVAPSLPARLSRP